MNHIIADNLRRLRMEKGYTQQRLADELGVGAQTVSRWECANTLPDVLLLPKIARLFSVTVDDLYREKANAYANYAQRLVSVYEATGRTEDFLAAEQECIRLLCGSHTADDLRSVGVLYHYMTRRCASKAEEYLTAAMEKADRTDWVYSSSAQQKIALLCDLGRGNEAVAQYEKELGQDPDDPLRWLLCVSACHYAGQEERAYELAVKATERFPTDAALQVYAGNICRALRRYEEAFAYWQRVLELDRSFYDARYSMGFCYEELGEYAKAFTVWSDLQKELLAQGFVEEAGLPAEHAKHCLEQLK